MYDIINNTLTFPHIVAGNELGGREHDFNSINGGIKMISDAPFNLIRNEFFGGNVLRLGYITEYGFYACPYFAKESRIVGFYIHSSYSITETGYKVLKDKYPDVTFIKSGEGNLPESKSVDKEQKKSLIDQAVSKGVQVSQIDKLSVAELDGLVRSMSSGKVKQVTVETPEFNVDDIPVLIQQSNPLQIKKKGE